MANHHSRVNNLEELEVRAKVVSGNEELRKEIMSCFKDLYTESSPWRPSIDNLDFGNLDDQDKPFDKEFYRGGDWRLGLRW